jgi:hypothetical protein
LRTKKKEENKVKPIKLALIIMAAALITFGVSGVAVALHDGGVAHCDACHTIHNSDGGAEVVGTVGPHLQKGSDPSSTCLNCHAGYGQYEDGANYRSGGDFYWLTKDYSWSAHGRMQYSTGDSHGHNIIAADQPGLDVDAEDATLSIAPGGDYLSSQLGCNSCHDPHGSQGNEVLLYGVEDTAFDYPGGYNFTSPAPVFLNAGRTADVSDGDHSAYGSGMSEWCANCHGDFLNAIGKHPAGNNGGAALNGLASNYNAYVGTGDLGGTSATSFLEIVPFETGATDTTGLDEESTVGPDATSNVMCLTCHRAHASPFPKIGRWYFPDTLMLEDSHPMLTDTNATQEDVDNKWYGRVIPAGQRSYCNKCHIQD